MSVQPASTSVFGHAGTCGIFDRPHLMIRSTNHNLSVIFSACIEIHSACLVYFPAIPPAATLLIEMEQ
jgi:hypothetical protein